MNKKCFIKKKIDFLFQQREKLHKKVFRKFLFCYLLNQKVTALVL